MQLAQRTLVHNLYSSHQGWLRDWLRKRLGCSETAADLTQDTFIRLLLKDNAPQLESPRAYLSTIAKGLMINHWRRQALEQAYLDLLAAQPEPLLPSLEERQLVVEALLQLAEILDGLTPRDQQIFLLARLDGLKYQEIADQLNITVNSVQKAMVRATHKVYQILYDTAVE
ncbi:MAG: sigma-70 family RNA polymerase sigma factor [Cellvibrio sp.]|uniref:sigma-70 family RNA polymerase sigma factor n=1 Tax=Cellvibrio sp. TaxID=1965322 RepID=UPI0031A8F1C2